MEERWVPVTNIPALRSAISVREGCLPVSKKLSEPKGEKLVDSHENTVSLPQLTRRAEQTLWDKLPLRAIAEAHEKEAERLMARVHPDEGTSTSNNAAIYVEYCKYLRLYPDKDSPEYNRIAKRVYLLEQLFDGSTAEPSSFTNIPSAMPSPPSESHWMKWKFFILGVVAAMVVPFVVGRVGKRK